MKKKNIIGCLCMLAIIVCLCVILSACNLFGKKDASENKDTSDYSIQYSDDNGSHTITVKHGQDYCLEEVPHKFGHNFLGLFDRRSGGTQYIDEYGDSIGAFTDDKDMTLYPQFEAITYRIVYNYGDEPTPDLWNDGFVAQQATFGERWSVETTKVFPSKNVLNLQHKTFDGWFTSANGGTKIGDENGNVLTDHAFIDDAIVSAATDDNVVCLYAHYTVVKVVVNFYDNLHTAAGSEQSTQTTIQLLQSSEVDYGTDFASVKKPKKSNLKWSWGIANGEGYKPVPDNYKMCGYEDNDEYVYEENFYLIDEKLVKETNIVVKDYRFPNSFDITNGTFAGNSSDRWDFITVFGYSLEQLRVAGYTKMSVSVELRLKEINDGYQQIALCRSNDVNRKASLWFRQVEHSRWKVDTSEWGHELSGSVDLDQCIETMGWYYCYDGTGKNSWRKCSLTVTYTLS